MKSYSQYKDSGLELIKQIPIHWDVAPLKFIGKIILGKMLTPEDKGGYTEKPYLRAKNIGWETVDAEDIKTMWLSPYELEQYRLKQNDLLISEGGEVGRTAIWNSELDECYIQNSVHKVTISHEHNPRYYLYHSQVFGKTGYYDSIVNRVSIAHLTGEKLKDIRFVVPPPPEQQAIADFLDCKTTQIDTLIQKKQRQIDLLQEQRTALINHAVTRGLNPDAPMKDSGVEWLGEIPNHWKVMKVAYFVDKITNGYVGPTRDILREDGVRYIQSLHIKKNTIEFRKPYYVSQEWSNEHERTILRENDVLVVQTGAMTGEVGIVPKKFDGANCHALIILRVKAELGYGQFLINALTSNYGHHSMLSIMTGALHPHLNTTYLRDVYLAVPPKNEQQAIVEYIENKTREIDLTIKKHKDTISLLQEYRTALISEAVTGKINIIASDSEAIPSEHEIASSGKAPSSQ